jgi:hypothetical protein
VIVFSCLMATLSLQLIIEAVKSLVARYHPVYITPSVLSLSHSN